MKKIYLIPLFFSYLLFAQAPAIQWQKCIGGSDSDDIYSIKETGDGGFIVAGNTRSIDLQAIGNNGNQDILVVKLNSSGDVQWSKCLGGTSLEMLGSITETSDNGFAIIGSTFSNDGNVSGNHGNSDVWIVKLDTSGSIVWQKTFGGTSQDNGNYIQQTSDGFIAACQTYSGNGNVSGNHGTTDAWILKLDNSGTLLWQHCYGGTNFDSAVSIQQTADAGYAFTGSTNSISGDVTGHHGTTSTIDYWVVKISNTGVLQWQKCLGGTSNEEALSLQQTNDNGYILSGYTSSIDGDVVAGFHGDKDYWLVKLDSSGTIQWNKIYGGTKEDYAFNIKQTTDGGFITTGYTGSNDGDIDFNHATSFATLDIWVLKLDSNGIIVWQKSLGNNGYQDSHDIAQTSDGGFIIAGNSGASSASGEVTGYLGGNSDFWVVKLYPTALGTPHFYNQQLHFYPNPVNDCISLYEKNKVYKEITIFNITGEMIRKYTNISEQLNVFELAKGNYIIQFVDTDNIIYNAKFIKN